MYAPARASDPLSSHEAADYMASSGKMDFQRKTTAAAVARHPGLTASELSCKTGVDRYLLGRRLSECVSDETVRRGAIRRCRVTKRLAQTWYPPEVAEQLSLAIDEARAA